MKGIKSFLPAIHLSLSLVLIVILFWSMPRYSQPFGGCDSIGFNNIVLGCSSWPDFLYGFLAILLSFLPDPRFRVHIMAFVSILLIAAMGWSERIDQGFRPELDSVGGVLSSIMVGGDTALVFGAGVALVMRLAFRKWRHKRK